MVSLCYTLRAREPQTCPCGHEKEFEQSLMSPTLRNVRQEQAVRAFVRAGGRLRTGKGSHQVVTTPNGRNLSVPSGVLKVGLLKHLIKMADISEEEFLRLL